MKIQRKLKRKNTNRKTHVKQSQNELINPADLPPHILDKIPPGLSMKPNAATIRQSALFFTSTDTKSFTSPSTVS